MVPNSSVYEADAWFPIPQCTKLTHGSQFLSVRSCSKLDWSVEMACGGGMYELPDRLNTWQCGRQASASTIMS
ncbi:hypothetical protein BaRGS_00017472 [Batillaria attramentaria]|uniref:Uncharacterized protein n=1 Tax=Batillaria attramentaria TaxID=370345 RepID=A0ABD0KV93_9CAEN